METIRQIQPQVFSVRRRTFLLLLSYDTVADLRGQKHLGHLSDKVLEDYEEKVQDAD
jgi:hypothetical protein